MTRKRYFEPKDKSLPKGYDSKLEYRLHQTALSETQFHPPKEDVVSYSITHTYTADFIFQYQGKMYVVETKGRMRDASEMAKYKFVREHLTDWHVFKKSKCKEIELIFIFEKASTPTPFAKKRKDGTKQTHGEWASKNGFRWLCEHRGDLKNVLTLDQLIDTLNHHNQ